MPSASGHVFDRSFDLGRDAALLVVKDDERRGDSVDERPDDKLEPSLAVVLAAWRATGRRVVFGSIHDSVVADELAAAGVRTLILLGSRVASESTARAVARGTALGHRTYVVSDASGARPRPPFVVEAATLVAALARTSLKPQLGWPFSLEPV